MIKKTKYTQVNAHADCSSLLASIPDVFLEPFWDFEMGLLFLATNTMYFTKAGKIVMLASRL